MAKEIKTTEELKKILSGYTGTEKYHSSILPSVYYTDGVKAMAEIAGAFWLIDVIASYQHKLKNEFIQFWTIQTNPDKTAKIICCRDIVNGKPKEIIIQQDIEYTDFPQGEFRLYVVNEGKRAVILLPSEW